MAPSNNSKPQAPATPTAAEGQAPTADSGKPAAEGQAPTADSGKPAAAEQPAVPGQEEGQADEGQATAPDGGEQSPEPTRDEAEEERLLRELETSDVPAAVKNVGRNVRRVGFAMVAPGETHKVTKRERESERMMKKVRHAIRTGFLVAAE